MKLMLTSTGLMRFHLWKESQIMLLMSVLIPPKNKILIIIQGARVSRLSHPSRNLLTQIRKFQICNTHATLLSWASKEIRKNKHAPKAWVVRLWVNTWVWREVILIIWSSQKSREWFQKMMKAHQINGGGYASTPPITISCLVWNCRGLGNPRTENELTDLVWAKDPSVVFLAETWADEVRLKNVLRKIRCENIFNAPRTNRGGGLVLFWRSSIDATMDGSGTNYIDATFQEEDRAGIGVIIRDCQGKGLAQRSEIIPLPLTVVELETLATSKSL